MDNNELSTNLASLGTDCISRQSAIDAVRRVIGDNRSISVCDAIKQLPPIQPVNNSENPNSSDVINRQAAIDAARKCAVKEVTPAYMLIDKAEVMTELMKLPSAQPERTCVNCGRTANNGGWYADGGTRCPIEEHYALPKDGYCHLWEKRNVTDDDYPERRTNNANIDT